MTPAGMEPHRGTVILVLGILGLLVCQVCSIIAWVLANADLKKMAAGQMDPAGHGMTHAGKICGIVGVILAVVTVIFSIIFVVVYILFFAVIVASGGV